MSQINIEKCFVFLEECNFSDMLILLSIHCPRPQIRLGLFLLTKRRRSYQGANQSLLWDALWPSPPIPAE